jgi:hypothetical protein
MSEGFGGTQTKDSPVSFGARSVNAATRLCQQSPLTTSAGPATRPTKLDRVPGNPIRFQINITRWSTGSRVFNELTQLPDLRVRHRVQHVAPGVLYYLPHRMPP